MPVLRRPPSKIRIAAIHDAVRLWLMLRCATDLGFTRDRHYSMRKSATADLRATQAPQSVFALAR